MKATTKIRKIREFKKDTEKKYGVEWFNVDFREFKKLSHKTLNEFFSLLTEKLEDASSWGRYVETIYWSQRDQELGITFFEHGDYKHQFAKYITFDALRGGEIKTFSDFVIKGIRKGLFIDTSDLYL